jgi:signal transduction histidine kinase/HD-like signal output (HDOD) protein
MKNSDVEISEQAVNALFCMPQLLVDLIEACLSGGSTQELAEIILQDVALSARVIHAAHKCNGARLDSSEPITSAIQILGIPVVTGIALQAARQIVASDFSADELVFLNGLWYSSQISGRVARCLSPTVSYLHLEEAQLAGLMLNLGIHALYARHRDAYVGLGGGTFSSVELCEKEEEQYQLNHLQVAETLIGAWRLDSFLVDAIKFLHIDVSQIENSSQLLKIARLAQQVCQQPQELTPETEALAERLFQFNKSESVYLFSWAQGLYEPQAPELGKPKILQSGLKATQARLIDLIFALADQEGARARLASCNRPEDLVHESRDLYLENSAATEAVFLLVDHKHNQLAGVVAPGQARLINEMKVPLDASASRIAQAILKGEMVNTFDVDSPLTVTDQLLLRICDSQGFVCQPFRLNGRMLGVVILGVDAERELPDFKSLRLQMFAQVVAEALAQLSSGVQERLIEGNTLLRRVSHEVSNPLTIISNYAEVLNHLLADNENRELPEAIKSEVRRIDEVLNYYLNKQEMPRFPDQSVSLNQLVHEAVDALQESDLQPRQIDVKMNLKNDLRKLATNSVLVKQILVNLLKNAAEAVDKGGVVSLSTRDSYCSDGRRYAEVVVQDNGSGIDQKVQDKLFRPVVSTKGPGHEGVGLSIVKGMVDDLGGRISYHTSSVSGTGFHLQLPYGETVSSIAEQI